MAFRASLGIELVHYENIAEFEQEVVTMILIQAVIMRILQVEITKKSCESTGL